MLIKRLLQQRSQRHRERYLNTAKVLQIGNRCRMNGHGIPCLYNPYGRRVKMPSIVCKLGKPSVLASAGIVACAPRNVASTTSQFSTSPPTPRCTPSIAPRCYLSLPRGKFITSSLVRRGCWPWTLKYELHASAVAC
jgi:hypothetical protein